GSDVVVQYAELRNMIQQAVQRRQSEQALLTSEERYRAVVESQVELICRFRPDGTLLFVNGAFCRYYGKTMDELLGRRFIPSWFSEDRPLIHRHFTTLSPDNPTGTMQHRIRCPALGTRWQQWSDTAIFDERGDVVEYQSVGRDITERKRTEEELRNTLSLIAATLESTDNGILVTGREGQFVKANRRFAALWNVPARLLIAGNEKELIRHLKDQLCDPASTLFSIPTDGSMTEAEGSGLVYFRDGRVFERNSKAMVVAGEPQGRVWSFRDITERVRSEKILKEANKKLYLLNTVTRHDVMNHVTALSSLLQLARQRPPGPELDDQLMRAEQLLDTIGHQIAFMGDYQDIDVHTPRWQSPEKILAKVSRMVRLHAITVDYQLEPVEIYADHLLEKVFFNLVDNAVRHGGGITRVSFSYEITESGLVIFCSDDGKGVPADEKDQIFNLGYGKHTGFGLYLAREILSITGIILDETGKPGEGAVFRLMVPPESYRLHEVSGDEHG
ncbi:MAG: PAS domain S-box protein, partial [Methanomicrobiales archaeon]|nr:PAS domain S-box protein [Methanomicrobiales archaeon]